MSAASKRPVVEPMAVHDGARLREREQTVLVPELRVRQPGEVRAAVVPDTGPALAVLHEAAFLVEAEGRDRQPEGLRDLADRVQIPHGRLLNRRPSVALTFT